MAGVGFAQRLLHRVHIFDNLNGRGKPGGRPLDIRRVPGRHGCVRPLTVQALIADRGVSVCVAAADVDVAVDFLRTEGPVGHAGAGREVAPAGHPGRETIAICYSSLGGLRAVVITDLFQFLLLFGGAVLVVVTVSLRLDGLGWIPTEWNAEWKEQPLFSFDPAVRMAVFGTILQGTLWWVCTAGADQTAIQRFMATGDVQAARRSFLVNSIAGAAVSIVLALVGFALLSYYQSDPQRLPPNMSIEENADVLFPYFISHHLPIGLSGLVVSGMFAAAMSSLDSGINSITAVVMTDFVDRFRKRTLPDKLRVRAARLMVLGIGLTVVSTSSLMEMVPGNFLEMTKRTIGLFVTPLFTLFCMAFFVRFATQTGTILGSVAGLLSGVLIAYWETPTRPTND